MSGPQEMRANTLLSFTADKATIKKSALNSVIIRLLFKLKGIITLPIMTYYLQPNDMGIYNLIIVTASLFTPLFYMNLADGPAVLLVQEKSTDRIKDMYRTVVNSSFLFFLLYSVVFLVIIKCSYRNHDYIYWVLPVIFSTILYKLSSYLLAVFLKTTELVKNALFKDAFGITLLILLLVVGLSYKALIYAIVLSNIIAGAYIYRLVQREIPFRLFIDKKILVEFLKMSLPLLPVSFFCWVIYSSDSYFLLYYKGEDYVGKYAVIYGLSNVILILTWTLNLFWFPVSAKLWTNSKEKYRRFFVKIFFVFSTILLVTVLLFELNSKTVMQILVRRAEYHDAYVIMGTIAFAFAMQVLITLLTAPLYSNKNIKLIFIIYLIGGAINCALNFLLIPSIGLWGAAVATVISYTIIVVLMSYSNYSVAKFRFFDKRLLYVASVFGFAWPGVAYLREHIQLYQLLLANIAFLLAAGTLLYFRVLNSEEKEYICAICGEFRSRWRRK